MRNEGSIGESDLDGNHHGILDENNFIHCPPISKTEIPNAKAIRK